MKFYVFGIGVEGVPHGGDDLGHFAERGVGVLTFDGRLRVPEEQRVRRHRLLRFVRISPLLLLLGGDFGFFGGRLGADPRCGDAADAADAADNDAADADADAACYETRFRIHFQGFRRRAFVGVHLGYYLRHGVAVVAAFLTGVATGRCGRDVGRIRRNHSAAGAGRARPTGRGHAARRPVGPAHWGRPQRLQSVSSSVDLVLLLLLLLLLLVHRVRIAVH